MDVREEADLSEEIWELPIGLALPKFSIPQMQTVLEKQRGKWSTGPWPFLEFLDLLEGFHLEQTILIQLEPSSQNYDVLPKKDRLIY